MRKGWLNKRELARVGRIYKELDEMIEGMPRDPKEGEEKCAQDLLWAARSKMAELLRWQDFSGVWQDVRGNQP